jgi:hypothetical protein
MSDIPMSSVSRHGVGGCAGSGSSVPGGVGWLSLAAAPTFALMALWTASSGTQPDMLCMQSASPLTGMTAMYLLMSVFHGTPWLRWLSRRRRGG